MNILGTTIKTIRKSKKMTQTELAKLTGFKQNTISNHENGNRNLDEVDIRKYAKALGISPQELFNHSKNSSITNPHVEITPSSPQSTAKISDEVIRLDKELKDPRHSQWISHGERLLEEQQRAEQIQEAREVAEPTAHYHIERPNISSFDEYRKRVPKTVDFAASAGTGVCQEENLDMEVMFYEDELAEDYDSIGIVMGSSMEPVLKNGDYLFVKITTDIPNGAISIWQVNGENYVKKFRNNGRPYLESLNPEFDDIDLDEDDDIRPLGVVVDVYREN